MRIEDITIKQVVISFPYDAELIQIDLGVDYFGYKIELPVKEANEFNILNNKYKLIWYDGPGGQMAATSTHYMVFWFGERKDIIDPIFYHD